MSALARMDAARHMDGIYRYQRHIYDLTRKYYLLGRDRMIAGLSVPAGATVLEVGCGTGRNLIRAARVWPHAQCFGFDISPAMLDTAQRSIARAGLGQRVSIAHGDAMGFDPQALFGRAWFDRIFLSYTLSMIPDWKAAIGAACDALADRGALHIVDFGQQERLPRGFRAILFAWLARFDVTPRADMKRVLAEVAEERRMLLEFTPLWRGYAWEAVLRKPARSA